MADPDTGKLTGQIDAKSTVLVGTGTDGAVEVAVGKVDGKIVPNRNVFSTATARIIGTSNIQFSITANNPFTQIGYTVSGFKQQDI